MLRCRAPRAPKPPAALALPGLIVPVILVFSSCPAPVAAAEMAEFGADGTLFTRIEQSLKLCAGRGYDNVRTQAESAELAARNGNTGQITMFVLLFTFLSALTLLMWRHARRDDASPRRIGRGI